MVDYLGNPGELRRRLTAYAYHQDTPSELAERLQELGGVDADVITEAPEILYAHFDLLSEQGLTVLAQLAGYGVAQNWTGLNRDGRWQRISEAARRGLGEKGDVGDPEGDPEPQTVRRADGVDWRAPPKKGG